MSEFTALSGPEVKKYLLAKIEEELDKSDKFGNHLTHPWFKYMFQIGLSTYPQQAMEEAPIKIVGTIVGEEGTQPTGVEVEIPPSDIFFKQEVIDTPDKARIETNQPIPTPMKGPGDVLVDRPVVAKFPQVKGKEK